MREYKYIVFLNGIVYDSVWGPNMKVARRRACKMVRSEVSSIRYRNVPAMVELETVKSFLSH